jgi:hypothetical protein
MSTGLGTVRRQETITACFQGNVTLFTVVIIIGAARDAGLSEAPKRERFFFLSEQFRLRNCHAERAAGDKDYVGFAAQSEHQPSGLMFPSTSWQVFEAAAKCWQLEHF